MKKNLFKAPSGLLVELLKYFFPLPIVNYLFDSIAQNELIKPLSSARGVMVGT